MQRTLLATALSLSALAALPAAQAATLVDTGEPNLSLAALSIDSIDWAADEVNFSTAVSIDSIKTYLIDDTPGETYTIALYKNLAGLPDTDSGALFTGQATFTGTNGWQGLTGLNWQVGAGKYWIGIESRATDSMTYGSLPVPVASGSGVIGSAFTPSIANDYQVSNPAQYAFGLQITGTTPAVPEPTGIALLLAGLSLITWLVRRQADENDE